MTVIKVRKVVGREIKWRGLIAVDKSGIAHPARGYRRGRIVGVAYDYAPKDAEYVLMEAVI